MASSAGRGPVLLLLAAASILAVAAGFAGTSSGHFLTDDWFILGKAAQFHGANLHHVFALGPGQLHWRPLPDLLWALEFDLFGLDPRGWHLAKLALHATGAVLLGLLARRWAASAPAAFFASLLFALHPLGCAPGVWIASTHENLVCAFFLATLLALDRHAKGEGGLLPLGLAFLGAILSKETGVTVVALAAAYSFLIAARGDERRRAIRGTALLFLLAAAYTGVRLAAGGVPGSDSPFRPPLGEFLWSLSLGPLRWIALPVSETAHANPTVARLALGGLEAFLLLRWLALGAPCRRAVGFAFLVVPVAMLTIAPFFTSASMGPEMWRGLFVGHYLLLPVAGVVLAIAIATFSPSRARILGGIGAALFLGLSYATLRRNLGPWIEAGEVSARFAAGIREHIPTRPAGTTLAVGMVGRPVWHRGVRIDPGQPLEFALEKGWPLPPYPTERGIPLAEVQRYLEDLQTEMPYKPVTYATREDALAGARRALDAGVRREDLVILEWDEGARVLRPLDF